MKFLKNLFVFILFIAVVFISFAYILKEGVVTITPVDKKVTNEKEYTKLNHNNIKDKSNKDISTNDDDLNQLMEDLEK